MKYEVIWKAMNEWSAASPWGLDNSDNMTDDDVIHQPSAASLSHNLYIIVSAEHITRDNALPSTHAAVVCAPEDEIIIVVLVVRQWSTSWSSIEQFRVNKRWRITCHLLGEFYE